MATTQLRKLPILVALAGFAYSCGDPSDGTDSDASGTGGNGVILDECNETLDPSAELLSQESDDTVPLAEGESIYLVFGSQSGMETPVSAASTSLDLGEVTRVVFTLFVDDAPIGEAEVTRRNIECDTEDRGRADAGILIDVYDHPTIVSVIFLDGRAAELRVEFLGEEGVLASDSALVILHTE